MKIVATGSFLISDGEVFEIPVGEGVARFAAGADLPAAGAGEFNVSVPLNAPERLVGAPSTTWLLGDQRVRSRFGFAATLFGTTLVHYTFFTE